MINTITNNRIEAIIGRNELIKHSDSLSVGTILISITDPDKDKLPVDIVSKFKGFLEVSFWDLEKPIGRFNIITSTQGSVIREFILNNKDSRFVIHCEAGISRSAAVGMAVECLLNHNGSRYKYALNGSDITNHNRYSPNLVVFDFIVPKDK